MKVIRAAEFTADQAWGARDIADFGGITARLHWTDRPYKWHVNDGAEIFVVLDGDVDMHYREADGERVVRLRAGDIFYAEPGDAHFAAPVGEARILVVESAGSV